MKLEMRKYVDVTSWCQNVKEKKMSQTNIQRVEMKTKGGGDKTGKEIC